MTTSQIVFFNFSVECFFDDTEDFRGFLGLPFVFSKKIRIIFYLNSWCLCGKVAVEKEEAFKRDIEMEKLILTFICLLLVTPSQAETLICDDDCPVDLNNIQSAVNDSNDGRVDTDLVLSSATAQRQPAVRYRLVEGSYLIDDCTICGRPTFQVPIRGSFWLKPTRHCPLFSHFAVRCLRFRSLVPQMGYEGRMEGRYRIGGEFALMHQMTLEGRINDVCDLEFDSGLVVPEARFPWIESDLTQVFPNQNGLPLFYYRLHLVAVPWPAMWFSTEQGFHSADSTSVRCSNISDGDLLSSFGRVVRKNRELTSRLGIMPVVPDLGLDAVLGLMPALSSDVSPSRGEIWFSAEDDAFSETLGELLGHGDLLSDAGRIVRNNAKLICPFSPQPPLVDYGLDAVALHPNGRLLFSTEEDFFSESLGESIGHGDLLCEGGRIFKRIGELLANFQPIEPRPLRFGLDAVYVWPNGEVWFSTEISFVDKRLGYVGHGDLLSDTGRVVAGNLELVGPFRPIEDLDDFGLDSLHVLWPCPAVDFDFDGDVDLPDFAAFAARWQRNHCGACDGADLTGDEEVGPDDLREFAENWLAGVEYCESDVE